MDTKEIIAKIRQEIKTKEEEQKNLKNQRKTVRLVGERTMDCWLAAEKALGNKYMLTAMYISYYILKHRLTAPKRVATGEKSWSGKPIYKIVDAENFSEAVSRCCGENCYLNQGGYDMVSRVAEIIEAWEKRYGNDEAK